MFNTLAAVIVETRPEKLKIALENHCNFLPSDTHIYLFGADKKNLPNPDGKLSEEKYFTYHIIQLQESINKSSYNRLLTSVKFWNTINEENILIFQHDSMLLRNGIEEFYEWDFIGAPIKNIPGAMNGGLSLRKKSAMLRVLEKFKYNNSTDGNEDVWYCKKLNEIGGNFPTKEIAMSFSVETIFGLNSLGTHCPEKWLIPDECRKIKYQYYKNPFPVDENAGVLNLKNNTRP